MNQETTTPFWRTLLFMPGDDMKKIAKGAALDVDAVIMDLEDGVALNQKSIARQTVHDALLDKSLDFGNSSRFVRINPPRKGMQAADIVETIAGIPDAYVIPKVETAREIQNISHTLIERELYMGLPPESIKLLAIIETARGVVNLKEIAQADSRLMALIFGAEDLAGDIGATRTPEGWEVFYARSKVVTHAAAFGLQAIDTPYVDIENLEGLRAESEKAMRMGYTGKLLIHPKQIEVVASVFTPSSEEVERAQALIDLHDQHQADGTGVFRFEGKMVDMPMIRAATRILAKARRAGKIE
jgi:citrate lyase beta subunit